jgi:hypothetical protein
MLTHFNPAKHLYGRGWLGLIPLVGGVVGIGLILLGIFKYRDKKLILIGTFALLFTIGVYGSMFYYTFYSDAGGKNVVPITQVWLNDLIKDVEFYKLKNRVYPDSLEQLRNLNNMELVYIDDPILSRRPRAKLTKFNYHKIGDKYILFSSGLDKIPGTSDDIYPSVAISDSSKFGLIIKKQK